VDACALRAKNDMREGYLGPARAPGVVMKAAGRNAGEEKEVVAKEGDRMSADAPYKIDEKIIIPAFRGGIETTTTTVIEAVQCVSRKALIQTEDDSSGDAIRRGVISSPLALLSCATGCDVGRLLATFQRRQIGRKSNPDTRPHDHRRRSGLFFASGCAVSTSLAPHVIKFGG